MPPIAIMIALADPTRCRIVEILQAGPLPVHQIAAAFDISRPAISRHLGVLKQARLISEKKTGRENRYALLPGRLKPIQRWLTLMAQAPKPVRSVNSVASRREPQRRPEPKPALDVSVAHPAAPILRRDRPLSSQMGFDF